MQGSRPARIGEEIRMVVADVLAREVRDPGIGFVTITHVKVSADLSIADVYMTIMGTPGQQTAALNALKHSAGIMRTKLTKVLTLRVAPFIKFHFDEDLKKELEVLSLLDKVAQENAELDRKRAEAGESAPQE